MVNLMNEPEADLSKHTPDGSYIPRVIYYDPATGEPDYSVVNTRGSPEYKFFYHSERMLFEGMRHAKKVFSEKTKHANKDAPKQNEL